MLQGEGEASLKAFRAKLQYKDQPSTEVGLLAGSDLDALCRARQLMGEANSFVLHEGQRLVATYRPLSDLHALSAGRLVQEKHRSAS